MDYWLFPVAIFIGIFTQSAAGFGMALVAMPLLTQFYDLSLVSPVIAIVGLVAKALLIIRYRQSIDLRAVWQITLASLLLVPLGVYALDRLNQDTAVMILGLVILGYALYAFFDLRMPSFERGLWAYGFGAAAGFLGGAFNASGPPVVIYGSTKKWSPAEFKGNLQGYALVNGAFIVFNHAVGGNVTPEVWHAVLLAVPAAVLAVWAGVSLDRFINPERFRKLVLVLLAVLGIRMIF